MTQEELQQKYDAAIDKVNKRRATIIKLCNKLYVNPDTIFAKYTILAQNVVGDYMRHKDVEAVVDEMLPKKDARDSYGNWNDEAYDWNSKIDQLIDNICKLYDVSKVAKNWEVKLNNQVNKDNIEKIGPIWDFLCEWEVRAGDWYVRESDRLIELLNEFHEEAYNYLQSSGYDDMDHIEKRNFVNTFNDYMRSKSHIVHRYRFGTVDAEDYISAKGIDRITQELTTYRFVRDDEHSYNYNNDFGNKAEAGHYEKQGFDIERLDKMLAKEKEAKYFDLVNRITAVVGEITDASNLSIGAQNGELNGIVVGTNGKCRVETVGAGGYNQDEIVNTRHGQIFHYRVLVHKLKA